MAHATTKTIEIVSPKATLTPCILDDDPAQLELLTEQVGILGYEAIATSNPEEALQLIRSGRCRMVFADVHMPGMTGYEFLDEALRCDPGGAPTLPRNRFVTPCRVTTGRRHASEPERLRRREGNG
jgi:CheY-like chemotaxis protein